MFDTAKWRKVTQEMVLAYDALEERPSLINGGHVPPYLPGVVGQPMHYAQYQQHSLLNQVFGAGMGL